MSERRGQRAQWHGGWGWGRTGPEYAAACTHPRTPTVDTHTPRPSPSPACRAPAPVRTRGTGVRYADVAGIDHIKEDIREVLDILLGDQAYLAMGAHPVRVGGQRAAVSFVLQAGWPAGWPGSESSGAGQPRRGCGF